MAKKKKKKLVSEKIAEVMGEHKYPRAQAIAIGISKAEKILKKRKKKK